MTQPFDEAWYSSLAPLEEDELPFSDFSHRSAEYMALVGDAYANSKPTEALLEEWETLKARNPAAAQRLVDAAMSDSFLFERD